MFVLIPLQYRGPHLQAEMHFHKALPHLLPLWKSPGDDNPSVLHALHHEGKKSVSDQSISR
jgi:hypothetical protein